MLRIEDARDVPFPDLESVFGTRGDSSRCWCQYFVSLDWRPGREPNRRDLRAMLAQRRGPQGLVAYVDDEPAAWVQLGPMSEYAKLAKFAPNPHTWWISCFVVRVGSRRSGLSRRLLDAAVDRARADGAEALRARPVDTRGEGRPGNVLYTGVLSTFLQVGFVEIARPSPTRPVVEIMLAR